MNFKQYDYVELKDGRKMVMIEPSLDYPDYYIGEISDEDGNVIGYPTVLKSDVKRIIE